MAIAEAAGWLRGGRDLRIDLLRGYAIFAMTVDHTGGASSWLYALSGGDRFYVSAAEGFVFLSGVVAGMVYGPRAERLGGAASIKLLKRAGVIYLWTIAMAFIEPLTAAALGLGWDNPLARTSLPEYFIGVITLRHVYHLSEVLLLYALLFSVAGLIIVWMVDGETKWVLLASWFVWAVWQTSTDYPAPWDLEALTVFQFAAWQALFVTGLAAGIHREQLLARLNKRSLRIHLAAGGLGLAGCIVAYQLRAVNRTFGADGASHILSKSDLGAGRLVVFAFLAMFAFALVTFGWRWLQSALGWLLLPLGQNALAAYILHVGVVLVLARIGLAVFGGARTPEQNALLQGLGVLTLWALIRGLLTVRSWAAAPLGDMPGWGEQGDALPAPVVSLRQLHV